MSDLEPGHGCPVTEVAVLTFYNTVVAKKIVSIWRVATGGPKSDSLVGLIGRSGASSRPL